MLSAAALQLKAHPGIFRPLNSLFHIPSFSRQGKSLNSLMAPNAWDRAALLYEQSDAFAKVERLAFAHGSPLTKMNYHPHPLGIPARFLFQTRFFRSLVACNSETS